MAKRRRDPDGGRPDDLCILASPDEGQKEEQTRQLEAALLRLSAEDRELITLKHLDGLSYVELAERLDLPPGTVMSRLYHVRRRLRHEVAHLLKAEEL
jgi:RNA polymerase sigma-70 factor (ECF subfamily)